MFCFSFLRLKGTMKANGILIFSFIGLFFYNFYIFICFLPYTLFSTKCLICINISTELCLQTKTILILCDSFENVWLRGVAWHSVCKRVKLVIFHSWVRTPSEAPIVSLSKRFYPHFLVPILVGFTIKVKYM